MILVRISVSQLKHKIIAESKKKKEKLFILSPLVLRGISSGAKIYTINKNI